MKIISKGTKTKECGRCGCVMEYDASDVRREIDYMNTSLFLPTRAYFRREYIKCPQCGKQITIGEYWL